MPQGVGYVGSEQLAAIIQAATEKASTSNQISVAVASKAQDVAKQQGQNAIQLIQSASNLVDVRA